MSTPETDSLHRKCHNSYFEKCTELIDLCRKLERERNEARDTKWADAIHSCHNECTRPICTLRRERDEARKALHDLMEEYEDRQKQYGDEYMWEKHEDTELIKAICKRLIELETNQPKP